MKVSQLHNGARHILASKGCRRRLDTRRFVSALLPAFIVACLWLPAPGHASSIKIGGTGSAIGTMRILADAFQKTHPGLSIEIPKSVGSGGAVKGVLKGIFALGVMSRPLREKERKAGAIQIPYAKTPFVFVTREGHGKDGLSFAELVSIFGGETTVWKDGTRIRLVLRPDSDSDTTLLKAKIPGMTAALAKARRVPGIPVAFTDQEALDGAETTKGVLTTGTLSSILSENRPLVPIPINGVAPTGENLANGSYPLFKILSFVVSPKSSPLAKEFIRFVGSAEGAAILRKNGQLPVSPGKD